MIAPGSSTPSSRRSAGQWPVMKIAVVGHTNTGKTSLMRTLIRDTGFGEVSDRPATTRHVEAAALLIDGKPAATLFDTPGLEDSMGLAERLDALGRAGEEHWVDAIQRFLAGEEAAGRFEQEAKALRQLLDCHLALYVIDARDRVLAKHRDELEILARCARPVVPVLNFVSSAEARSDQWREHLTKLGLHALVEFDTVVFNELGEQRLFEKMRSLLDSHADTLDALIDDRRQLRRRQIRLAGAMLADLLIDVAALRLLVPEQEAREATALEPLRSSVRQREQRCVNDLLDLFRFRETDFEGEDIPLSDGRWGLDLFSPEALRRVGIRTGGGAVAGGLAGLAVDAATGGLSLGMAAALGATMGGLMGSIGSYGRQILDAWRGYTQLRVDDQTLRLLALRQLALIQALLRRGHAAQEKIALRQRDQEARQAWQGERLPDSLLQARDHPEWSRMDPAQEGAFRPGRRRRQAVQSLVRDITGNLNRPGASSGSKGETTT